MKIITIMLGTDGEGRSVLNVVPSDGVEPAEGAEACRKASESFLDRAIEAEVQRRLEAAQADDAPEEADDDAV